MTDKAEDVLCSWLEVVIRDEVNIPTIERSADGKICVIVNLTTTSKQLTKYLGGHLTGQELRMVKKIWADDTIIRKFVLKENGDLQITFV